MASPEVVDYARNFAVMVRVQGPDPKGLKMRKHAFHQYHSGRTTLSASGMLLPDTLYDSEVAKHIYGQIDPRMTLVVTISSIFEPFLPQQQREMTPQGRPELIPGVHIDVMVEREMLLQTNYENSNIETSHWLPVQLLALLDIPASAVALNSLVDASLGSPDQGWEVGWSLASHANGPQPFMDLIQRKSSEDNQRYLAVEEPRKSSHIGKLTTKIAVLGVSLLSKNLADLRECQMGVIQDVPSISVSPSNRRGSFLLAVGSPFGILSPMHFFNSISVGSIANGYPANSSCKSLLMADIRCLPGMEGCPVFDDRTHFVGILIKPLRQNISGAEIQLVIPWEAIATACSDLLKIEPNSLGKRINNDEGKLSVVQKQLVTSGQELYGPQKYTHKHFNSCRPSPLSIEKAMASICLVTIDDGVWASGILLNHHGLILTNAHLLEPWRFGKTTVSRGRSGTSSELLPVLSENSLSHKCNSFVGDQKNQSMLPESSPNRYPLIWDEHGKSNSSSVYRSHRNIRVRLDHMEPWVWCDAKLVYICKGPLDIALLQLEQIPNQLSPIVMDFTWPSVGSKASIIGHALFGPKCGFFPSVSSGVVAKVVKAKIPESYPSFQQEDTLRYLPAMIETTASVHPGGSGGAVVNSDGHMIGIVTSNARHGGGTVIPHMNFSIPCAALAPIFTFSKDMNNLSVLRILDDPDEQLSCVWALMPPLSPKPPPLPTLPQSLADDSQAVKGSRFTKFIADRRELLKNPTARLGKAGGPSSEIITSKL